MTTCPSISLLPVCIGGGLLAGGFLFFFARRKGVEANSLHLLQVFAAAALGVALGGTLHLMYGAACPDQLVEVEVHDRDKKRLELPEIEISVKVDNMHKLDILLGGTFLVYLSYRGLKTLYQNPTHL